MNKEKAQQILNLVERALSEVRNAAYKEKFILGTKRKDVIYSQILNLLIEKKRRTEGFLEQYKE